MKKEKADIICIFVPYGVEPTSRQKNLPYKWEEEDGTFYSVMPREAYNDYLELEEENKKLKKYYDRDKEELMESCYGLARENDELKKENETLNEKVRFLEECLDRKEKLNEKYRKELKSTYVYDAKQVRDIC